MRTALTCVLVLALGGLMLWGGCASTEEAEGETESDSTITQSEPARTGPNLASQSEDVQTVQLYRGDSEHSFPVTSLRSGEPLTLEFDLMEREGRPLSIYFYHADRNWRRDLSPSQILESYQNDKIDEYRASQGTDVPYVHYRYRLPNEDIRFRISGNYVLRVTERGRRDSVLFERPFFVTDEAGTLRTGSESIRIPGQRQQSVRPVARFDPPASLRGDPFGYTVCFVQNGRLPDTRCQDRPRLAEQPTLEFELERRRAFGPTTADYTVDLGNLRAGPKIERVDRTASPFRVLLKPDYAQFSGRDVETALNGHIVVREAVRGRSDPALTAEYVRTTFAFVPPQERPLGDDLVVAGSFSGMDAALGTRMHWKGERGRYEGEVLLKQGRYQYFYQTSDPSLRQDVRETQARLQNTYTTFVYYEDPSRNTDRLLRVRSFQQ